MVYLVDCPELFSVPSIYTAAPDEYRRYLLLTHAAFLSCQRMGFAPQILQGAPAGTWFHQESGAWVQK